MTVDTSERQFENDIENALIDTGFNVRFSEDYDKKRCIIQDDLISFIETTQQKEWEKLKTQHGAFVRENFLRRVIKEIERRGTLGVLRRGVIDLGCKFDLAYFKPETTMNVEHRRRYNSNIFSVVRQLYYSERDARKSIDLVIFLNGLPIFTAELKEPLKGQTVENAMWQYMKTRDPREPLLKFGRCFAHFAADPDLVYFTTRLKHDSTRFFPFNKGRNLGAGNPDNPNGYKTSYLWEEIWQKDSILEIINHYLHIVDEVDEMGRKTGKPSLIFPRYHQLEAVKRLVVYAKENGPGNNYLVQHSAGSGKSYSIAWLSHRLAGLHDAEDKRVFDSILVVTDRRVLDRQLRRSIVLFEQVKGLVRPIVTDKARNLTEALESRQNIIITTLQTFPFAVDLITKLAGKRFAVIVDEAHSSQSGESAAAVKKVLSVESLEKAEEEDVMVADDEDIINARIEKEMRRRGRLDHVSFFAFTATPKNKTMELFGTPLPDGGYAPFSLYSMKQAIEEKFILNVLENYTTFKVYFSLLKKIEEDPKYEKKKAIALLRSYADLHEHAINEKTKIIVEHFWTQVKNKIGGAAKAMVVTRSRLHAVRYKLAFDKYVQEQGYPIKTLVAFSGKVVDPDTGIDYTESSMNGFPESRTVETFNQNEYRILIAAYKFQTGFDQPLLHTMYVDKKLGGVNAVQTLSRLNRIHPNKGDTMILDFANEADEIRKAFQPYFEETYLPEPTDPNKLYDFQYKLENYHIYERSDVDEFARVYFSVKGTQDRPHAVLNPVVDRYREKHESEQVEFKRELKNYIRLYAFLSQIITFTDEELEKLYQFARNLYRKLPSTRDSLPVEIYEKIDMESYRIKQTSSGEIKLMNEGGDLKPISELGLSIIREKELEPLSEIIRFVNEHFGTEFTEEDKVRHFVNDMERRLISNEALIRAADPTINTSENFRLAFSEFFDDTLDGMIDSNFELYKKIVDNQEFGELFKEALFRQVYDKVAKASTV